MKQRFMASANTYQQTYAEFINEKTDGAGGGWWAHRGSQDDDQEPIDPYELPLYNYEEASTSELINGALPDIGILIMFNLVFFAGAFIAFLKYDVR